MAGKKPQVNIELVPQSVEGNTVSPAYIRATEILLKAKARKEAAISNANRDDVV